MEVKPGYKQTELGVIPKEWNAVSFSEILEFRNGANADKEAYGKGVPFVNVLEVITKGHLKSSDIPGRVLLTKSATESYSVRLGDLVFNRTSETDNELALTAVYMDEKPVVFGGFVIRGRPTTKALDPLFSGYAFRARSVRSQIIARGQGAIRANIGQSDLRQILIALPALSEQRAIAGALSDVDALLGALDQLIAKKRDLKQAAMQQLLTGTKRLPGFQGKWTQLNMAENSTLKARIGWQGLTTAEYLKTGEYYLVTGTDFANGRVEWSSCCFVAAERYVQDRNIQLRAKDIVLTKDGTIGKVGFINNLPGPATLNSGVFVIRPKENAYDPHFFYFVLTSRIFDDFLNKLQAGSTISHLYQKDFVTFSFLAPATLAEQTAIAEVLTDMDAELAALEQRRAKTRALKQGMMQELLTGRTRLI
jgi:type I restriction enzyme S subunit